MSYQHNAYQPVAFQTGQVTLVTPGEITNVYNYFTPDMAFIMEDAFERAGISPQAIDNEKMYSAMRSMQLMLGSEWLTYGIRQWLVKQNTETITAGDNVFDMPVGSVEMLNIVSRRAGGDVPMYSMSRKEYTELAVKTTQGRPSRYFQDKEFNRNRVYVWPVPEIDTTVVYDYLQTAAEPGTASNILELASVAVECFTAGLAMRLALKFNNDRYSMLKEEYGGPQYPSRIGGLLFRMRAYSGENADVQFNFRKRR